MSRRCWQWQQFKLGIWIARDERNPSAVISGEFVADDMGGLTASTWDQRYYSGVCRLHDVDDDAMHAYWGNQHKPQPPKVARALPARTARDLARIQAKLERWELSHLRELAAEQAERIEQLERTAAEAARSADLWHDLAIEAQDALFESGAGTVGITRDGRVLILPAQVEWHPA